MNEVENRTAIIANEWFRELPEDVVEQLVALAIRRKLGDGEMLYAKDAAPDGLYGVLRGRIRSSAVSAEGKELLIALFEPGNWFGEISMFDGLGRIHDGIAVGETEVLILPRQKFLALLEKNPHLYPYFLKMLCRKVRLALGEIENMYFLSVPVRLAKRLLTLSRAYGRQTSDGIMIDLHLPQDELGRMLGVTRQSISRILRSWEEQSWIKLQYGRLLLCNEAALLNVAAGNV